LIYNASISFDLTPDESFVPGMAIYRASPLTPWVIEEPRASDQPIDMIILHFTELNYLDSFRVLTTPHTVSAHYLV